MTKAHPVAVGEMTERAAVDVGALIELLTLDSIVVVAGEDREIQWVSGSVADVLGWTPDEFRLVCTHLIHPEDQPLAEAMSALIRDAAGTHHGGEGRHLAADGSWRWLRISAHNDLAESGTVVTVFRDVTAEHELLDRLARAEVDALTGLETRPRAEAELCARLASGEHRVAVLFCDVDGFKAVNDRLGHAVGDEVLVEVARRARSAMRPGDLLARWGGDEMLVIADVRDEREAFALAEAVRDAVHRDVPGHAPYRPLSVSVGIALGGLGDQPGDIVARADRAMYAAKRTGQGVSTAS